MTSAPEIGVVGLGVMGRSLALNMADHGLAVSGADSDLAAAQQLETDSAGRARGFHSATELAEALPSPRRIMIMVPAGPPVDAVIESLSPSLSEGDVLIDGGNSHFTDTERRMRTMTASGVHFVGAGVSGGEEGARHGPSIMPGGAGEAWDLVRPILQPIAAVAPDGTPCCDWLGSGGSGHAVKTVHNGIEYAFMQAICEAYAMLEHVVGMAPADIAATFAQWNTGPLASFLVEITAKIFDVTDDDGLPLVNKVLDEAGQKGTGRWTAEMGLGLGVPCPTLATAVFARGVSSRRPLRQRLATTRVSKVAPPDSLVTDLHDALLATVLLSFAQGFDVISAASMEHDWKVRLDRVARLWRAGCIIRIGLLDYIAEAFQSDAPDSLLLSDWFIDLVGSSENGLRQVIQTATAAGVGCPAMSSALSYLDTMRESRLPHNLLQAQRDAFGAHRYRRTDRDGTFHTDWLGNG